MPKITTIPAEIWQEILAYACTDGGYTGRSVSLSCKYLNARSSKIRFQSVSISHTKALDNLVAYLRTKDSVNKPPVRHLWLYLMQERPPYDHPTRWLARFADTAAELITIVAPTLRTLYLLQGARLPPVPLTCAFPALVELTVAGSMAAFVQGLSERLPALRRLHLIPLNVNTAPPLLGVALRHTPLTHLRLSGILNDDDPSPYPQIIAEVLGIPLHAPTGTGGKAPEELPMPPAARELPSLRQVIVHTVQPDLGFAATYEDESTSEPESLVQALQVLAERCAQVEDGARLLVLQMEEEWYNVWDRLREDWVQRMEGSGPGCWVASRDEEVAAEERFQAQSAGTQLRAGRTGFASSMASFQMMYP